MGPSKKILKVYMSPRSDYCCTRWPWSSPRSDTCVSAAARWTRGNICGPSALSLCWTRRHCCCCRTNPPCSCSNIKSCVNIAWTIFPIIWTIFPLWWTIFPEEYFLDYIPAVAVGGTLPIPVTILHVMLSI